MTQAMPTPAVAPVLSGTSSAVQTTRLLLAFIEQRMNLYLRFGHPICEQRLDRHRRMAWFSPDSLFCRIRWEGNDHGTTRWQLMVLQAVTPADYMQRIPGVTPGASLLLCAEGERQVQAVLQRIDAIEAQGVDPIEVAPTYWRTLHNRLAARMPLPEYTAERHAAYLAARSLR